MPYTNGCKTDPAILREERELLEAGFSYIEIATMTGRRRGTIFERNRHIHKVDIWEAFKRRIERDGIPNRLTVSDAFGYWFSGFFDGEGSFTAFASDAMSARKYREQRLGVCISIRDDDLDVITGIKDQLQVGTMHRCKGNGTTNPKATWRCEALKDLGEVIVPLFDRYPLYTKKVKEYAVWKTVVLERYVETLGGYSNRHRISEDRRSVIDEAIKTIQRIRTYTRRV